MKTVLLLVTPLLWFAIPALAQMKTCSGNGYILNLEYSSKEIQTASFQPSRASRTVGLDSDHFQCSSMVFADPTWVCVTASHNDRLFKVTIKRKPRSSRFKVAVLDEGTLTSRRETNHNLRCQ